MESEKADLIEVEDIMVVIRAWESRGMGKF
jgi:hypothetical protein